MNNYTLINWLFVVVVFLKKTNTDIQIPGEKLHFCLNICSFKRIYNLAYNSLEENKERRFNTLAQMNGISSLLPI